jgi:hypothetical protein
MIKGSAFRPSEEMTTSSPEDSTTIVTYGILVIHNCTGSETGESDA